MIFYLVHRIYSATRLLAVIAIMAVGAAEVGAGGCGRVPRASARTLDGPPQRGSPEWGVELGQGLLVSRAAPPAGYVSPEREGAWPETRAGVPAFRHIARHVVIISEDGLRPDALLEAHGSVHALVMRQGSYSLSAMTIRHASTLPSHAAMLSGFDEGAHKLTWNSWKPERGYIQVPTIFDAVWNAGHGAAAFVGKQKLEHIAHPGSVDLFSRPGFFCKKVVDEAARYFVENHPEVEFVHFSDPDERGHAMGWMSEPQIEAIRHTDRCLATMIEAVHAAGLDDDTLFILSADHGGHGRNHSGRVKEDRLIPWIAWGVGVRKGHRITSPISTMDTAATALWALGYPAPPDIQGRPVAEAFLEAFLPEMQTSETRSSVEDPRPRSLAGDRTCRADPVPALIEGGHTEGTKSPLRAPNAP